MSDLKTIVLKKNRENSLRGLHPWIFSGAVKSVPPNTQEGDTVLVTNESGAKIALGFYGTRSIGVKIFYWIENKQEDFNVEKIIEVNIKAAFNYREKLGLVANTRTNAYRLVCAEGDNLPGLVIDIYNGVAVIDFQSLGMKNFTELIVKTLLQLMPLRIATIFEKNSGYLLGDKKEALIVENENKFFVTLENSQKTGFFLDQRENRDLISKYSKDKSVLNLFCYTGGFSINSLNAGAKNVVSVDSSKGALETLERNISLNDSDNLYKTKHKTVLADVFDFLNSDGNQYDVVISDPPAFAKHLKSKDSALRAYEKLFFLSANKVAANGILFCFTCSQVVSRKEFEEAVFRGVSKTKRHAKVISRLGQAPCHPQSLGHPEGEYLKGLVVAIN